MRTIITARPTALIVSAALLSSLGLVTVAAPVAAQVPTCDGKPATITDNDGNDANPAVGIIEGTNGNDVIVGTDGIDGIDGKGGRDTICGGLGDDVIDGGPKRDRIFGGSGADTIFGSGGSDDLFGFKGNDLIFGNRGNDFINGGRGIDGCFQGSGSGPIKKCEKADLKVTVSSPKTAPEGIIAFTVRVKNRGPNGVSYKLVLDEENSKARCDGPQPWEGEHVFAKLRAGATRTRRYEVTCTNEAEGNEVSRVWVSADVSNSGRETKPGNNTDRSRTIIE